MSIERPELRIVDAELWAEVQARLAAIHRKYTQHTAERIESPKKAHYLLSGILVCDECGFPLTIYGGGVTRYYRCNTHFAKGTCKNDLRVREEVIRADCLDAIREQIQTPQAIEYVRRKVSELLGNYTRELDRELKERRERLQRTEERIKGLVGFIADGDRSEYVDLHAARSGGAGEDRAGRDRAAAAGGAGAAPAAVPGGRSPEARSGCRNLITGNRQEARLRIRPLPQGRRDPSCTDPGRLRGPRGGLPASGRHKRKCPSRSTTLGILGLTCKGNVSSGGRI